MGKAFPTGKEMRKKEPGHEGAFPQQNQSVPSAYLPPESGKRIRIDSKRKLKF